MDDNKKGSFLYSLWEKTRKKSKDKENESEQSSQSEIEENIPEPEAPKREVPATELFKLWRSFSESPEFSNYSFPFIQSTTEFEDWKLEHLSSDKNMFENDIKRLSPFISELNQVSRLQLALLKKMEEDKKPIDAMAKIYVATDKMAAFMFMFPPRNEGLEAIEDSILKEVASRRIVNGLDSDIIKKVVEEKRYFQIFNIARGTVPVNGSDGKIIEHFSREIEIQFNEDEKGDVDLKSLNLIRNIKQNDVICTIVQPTEGVDGVNVMGEKISGTPGKAPTIPKGNNTAVSEDGTQLISMLDGHISYRNNSFNVENILSIDDNVDNAVGNIDFLGDVIIKGDVRNGFEVRASGNIEVGGIVEGAKLIAGGNITIRKGMNGNKQGSLDAQGDVKCKYLENSTVNAVGNVYAESIVWSDIYSDENVFVNSGKGVIIGGTITSRNSVEAKIIGTKSAQKTTIILGYSPKRVSRKNELEKEIKELQNTLSMITKNVVYLSNMTSLTPEKQYLFGQLKEQKILYEAKNMELTNELAAIEKELNNFEKCKVISGIIFPYAKIQIGPTTYYVNDIEYNCDIFYAAGEIILGSY